MAHFEAQSEPFVFDFKKLFMALADKEAVARRKLMLSWRIVQKGGRLGRARINSSDDV